MSTARERQAQEEDAPRAGTRCSTRGRQKHMGEVARCAFRATGRALTSSKIKRMQFSFFNKSNSLFFNKNHIKNNNNIYNTK